MRPCCTIACPVKRRTYYCWAPSKARRGCGVHRRRRGLSRDCVVVVAAVVGGLGPCG